jgi:AraC-like DNA-binding protein
LIYGRDRLLGAEINVFPTTRGDFRADVTLVGLNWLVAGHYRMILPQIGVLTVRPGRRALSFLTEHTAAMQYGGIKVLPGEIFVNGFDTVHHRTGHDHNSGSISLPDEQLSAAIEAVAGCNPPKNLQNCIIRPSPALMSRLLKLHKMVGQLAHDAPDILDQPETSRALEQHLTHLLVRCVAEGAGTETTTSARRHQAIVARFEQFLAENPDRPLYLTEICAGIGVAERTLRACCEDHLGMGPIRYLTLRRMHLVRRALLKADATNTTVPGIVADHGFWELGRFAVAYRVLFGESPSETLRHPRREAAIYLRCPSLCDANACSLPAEVPPTLVAAVSGRSARRSRSVQLDRRPLVQTQAR